MQTKHKLLKIIMAGLLASVLVVAAYFLYINQLPETLSYEGMGPLEEPEGINDNVPIIDGHKAYTNTTAGIYFEYPPDWNLSAYEDGYDTQYFSFSLLSPLFSTGSSPDIYISKRLSGMAGDEPMITTLYDNLPIDDQIKALDCELRRCKIVFNKNSVKILRYLPEIQCGDEGCVLGASVPTGKYIVDFSIVVYETPETLEKSAAFIEVFNKIIDSVKVI